MILINKGEKITEKDLIKFEMDLNIELPKDYRDFLLQNNGGTPQQNLIFEFFEVDCETGDTIENGTDVQNFSKLSEICFFYDNLIAEGVIPEKYFPIACDSFGNEILLCLQQDRYGMVYFGNHERYTSENMFVLSKISASFSGFINKMHI